MNEHVNHLLGALHDGELRGKPLASVENHLATCEICRAELDHLNALSELLLTAPSPSNLSSEDKFVAQVGLRMPRKPAEPAIKRVFNLGWQAAPVGILGVWAFVQSMLLVSGILLIFMRLGLDFEPLTDLIALPSGGLTLGMLFGFEGGGISDLGWTAIETLLNGGPFGWGATSYIAFLLILGLLYISWIASWWVRQRGHRFAREGVTHNQ